MTADPHPWAKELGTLYDHAWHRMIRSLYERHAHAADGHNALAMLLRRDGETLKAQLTWLHKPIDRHCKTGEPTCEVDDPTIN